MDYIEAAENAKNVFGGDLITADREMLYLFNKGVNDDNFDVVMDLLTTFKIYKRLDLRRNNISDASLRRIYDFLLYNEHLIDVKYDWHLSTNLTFLLNKNKMF